jgi:hypothetical protein
MLSRCADSDGHWLGASANASADERGEEADLDSSWEVEDADGLDAPPDILPSATSVHPTAGPDGGSQASAGSGGGEGSALAGSAGAAIAAAHAAARVASRRSMPVPELTDQMVQSLGGSAEQLPQQVRGGDGDEAAADADSQPGSTDPVDEMRSHALQGGSRASAEGLGAGWLTREMTRAPATSGGDGDGRDFGAAAAGGTVGRLSMLVESAGKRSRAASHGQDERADYVPGDGRGDGGGQSAAREEAAISGAVRAFNGPDEEQWRAVLLKKLQAALGPRSVEIGKTGTGSIGLNRNRQSQR